MAEDKKQPTQPLRESVVPATRKDRGDSAEFGESVRGSVTVTNTRPPTQRPDSNGDSEKKG